MGQKKLDPLLQLIIVRVLSCLLIAIWTSNWNRSHSSMCIKCTKGIKQDANVCLKNYYIGSTKRMKAAGGDKLPADCF